MRDAHAVDDPTVGRSRRVQIDVSVLIQQPEIVRHSAQQSANHSEGDGAVAAHHERNSATVTQRFNPPRNLRCNSGYPADALLFALPGIGLKTRDRQLAAIFEIEANGTKRLNKPGLTEGYRRLL